VRDAVQPGGESRRVFEFFEILVRLQKNILGQVERILAVPNQPRQVIEDALLPARDKDVVGIYAAPPRLGDQVAIFDLPKYQISAPFPPNGTRRLN